jgi:hypothetical protein
MGTADPVQFVDGATVEFKERADAKALDVADVEALEAQRQGCRLEVLYEALGFSAYAYLRCRFRRDMRRAFPPPAPAVAPEPIPAPGPEMTLRRLAEVLASPDVELERPSRVDVQRRLREEALAGLPEPRRKTKKYKAEVAARLKKTREIYFSLPRKELPVPELNLDALVTRWEAEARVKKCSVCGSPYDASDASHENCTLAPAYKHARPGAAPPSVLHRRKPGQRMDGGGPTYVRTKRAKVVDGKVVERAEFRKQPRPVSEVKSKPHAPFPPPKPIPGPDTDFALLEARAKHKQSRLKKWSTPAADRKFLAKLDEEAAP